jgi:glucoamylase
MDGFSNNGLLPEQVWDTEDFPEKGLFFGKHTGSAMPLTWAHAEYIKLCASIKNKRIFDMSLQTEARYIKKKSPSPYTVWRFDWPCETIAAGKILRIEVMADAMVRWSKDNWETQNDMETRDTGLGIYVAVIECKDEFSAIRFTFFWKESNHWENKEFFVNIDKG